MLLTESQNKESFSGRIAETVFTDQIHNRKPKISLAGESSIWALAKESGKYEKELCVTGTRAMSMEKAKMDALDL